MNRRFIWQVLLYALLFYLITFALDGIIFLLSHVPPKAVNLDGLLLRLGDIERFSAWPRFVMRRLWPGEATSVSFNYLLATLNYLIWGLILAALKSAWASVRK